MVAREDRLFAVLLHLHLARRTRSLFRARPGVAAISNYTIAKITLRFLFPDLGLPAFARNTPGETSNRRQPKQSAEPIALEVRIAIRIQWSKHDDAPRCDD